jgi:uncharacterized protein (DUF433 family)
MLAESAIALAEDPRYRPLYTLGELSRYARVKAATLRAWSVASEQPLIVPAAAGSGSPFSFVNLIEAHVLMALRKIHGIRMSQIRGARRYLSQTYGTLYPLAELDLETDGHEIFFRELGLPFSASAGGQRVFPEIIGRYLQRIDRDANGLPTRFFPYPYAACGKEIVMDPGIAFGQPVIAGTRIASAMVFERYSAGEGLTELAHDYGVPLHTIEEALRCEIERRAA